MAVIARTGPAAERSSQQRSFDAKLAVVIGVGILLGLLSDTKTNAAYPVVSYFATIFFYRRGLERRQAVLLSRYKCVLRDHCSAPGSHLARTGG